MPYRIRSCRNERRALAGVAAAILLLGPMAPAPAQQAGPPVQLLAPPPSTSPAVPEPPPAAAATASPATDESIKATPLAPIDAAWVGTLGDSQHPLPQTMWQGTRRALAAAALPQLLPTTSPALQDLSRRLLLSNAVAPQGQDTPDQPSLTQLRVERLAALGEIDGALAVLDALPATTHTDELDRRRIELYFAKNDVHAGCRQVQDAVARYQGVWWDRALIACQALGGDREKAALGMSLLKEQGAPPDPVFDALVNAVGGRATKLDKLPQPSPLLVTLLAAAKLPLPADAVAAADPPSLRAWAAKEAMPPLQRLAAAERAAALGALPPDALAALYAKVEFKPDELGAAIKQAKAPASARDRALLFQVARTDPTASVRATALGALLGEAKKRGGFIAMARVVAPILVEMPPSDDLAGFAPEAARALIAAGRPDAAAPWSPYVGTVDGAAATLGFLTGLAAGNPAPVPDPRKSGTTIGVAVPAPQMTLELALRSALDEALSPTWWGAYMGQPQHDGALPSVAVWLDQQQAAAGKRVGETVLTTLILARAGDHLSTEPIVLNRAIAGLKAVGLDGDARALALEAALNAGF